MVPGWSSICRASGSNVKYTSTRRRLDRGTGLYYYRHRFYASQLGRFGSRDPVGYQTGVNLVEYAWDSPTNRNDSSGLQPVQGPPVFYEFPPTVVWGPDHQLNVGALCDNIAKTRNCCKLGCTAARCKQRGRTLLERARRVTPVPPERFWQSCFDIFGGRELCQRWYLGFVEQIKGELEKNECYQTGGTSWVRPTIPNPFRAACYCPGHAAIQVTMCDETTTFYLDSGFWGGVFPPGESRRRDPAWCREITPRLLPWK